MAVMRKIIDLHIHSRFSRACSKNLTLSNLGAWARAKGIDILGTSDFTHPGWLAEIEERLEPAEEGLFRLRGKYVVEDGDGAYVPAPAARGAREVRFMLATEVSCIYKKGGMTRRLHLLVLAPDIRAVKRFAASLEAQGCNLRSDGRPILGIGGKEVLKMALDADPRCMVIPAHAWTPWFSVFGSRSGFDSLDECFEELTPQIHAIETGLSSDPPMNWRLSALDEVFLVSNSDAHGVRNLGREANAFDLEVPSYNAITDVLRKRQRDRFLYTIEFHPEEGKYHADGHRTCGFSCSPEETERRKGICPKCSKEMTRGVLGRVHALADHPMGRRPPGAVDHRYIVPLEEVIAAALGKGRASRAVFSAYSALVSKAGPEFDVLLDASIDEIREAAGADIAGSVERMRNGELDITPGFDGEFGKVLLRTPPKKVQGKLGI